MDITNAHAHLIELDRMVRRYPEAALPGGIAALRGIECTLPLLSPDALLAQMDEAGIARSILFAVEAPIVYASNEYVAALCDRYPDRFVGFASVDPGDPDAPGVLEQAVRAMGLKGLKLHPPLQGFSPNDQAVFPVYEMALALDIPVVFHVGTTPFGSLCRLAHANPVLIDDVAVRFPDLRIMLTHLGTLWHNEAFMVAEKNPNVFIDTAAYLDEIADILTPSLVERVGPGKFVFGTDYPMPSPGRPHRIADFVDCLTGLELPTNVLKGIFEDNIEALLCGAQQDQADISAADLIGRVSTTA